VAHGAVEVALALDAAVVLARRVLELDADPDAGGEGGLAGISDRGIATVAQLDLAAGGQLRERHGVKNRYLMVRHFVDLVSCRFN
jgi:hypothetical protein